MTTPHLVRLILFLKDLLPCEREDREIAIHIPFGIADRRVDAIIPVLFANQLIRQTRGIVL